MSTITEPTAADAAHETDLDPVAGPTQALEVRRDAPLSLLVGGTAGVVAVAFLLRAVGTGALLDWAFVLLTGTVAVMHLAAVVDARAPLFVIDAFGVRVRRGADWQGVAWSEVDHVEHLTRRTTVRDGSLTVVTTDGRRLGVRLSLSTRLVGADWHEVDDALRELSGDTVPVVGRAPREAAAGLVVEIEDDEPSRDVGEVEHVEPVEHVVEVIEPAEPAEPAEPDHVDLEPLRDPRPALRGEVVLPARVVADPVPEPEQDDEAPPTSHTQTIVIDGLRDEVHPGVRAGAGVDPVPVPTVEPVVGPQLAAARARIGISVESLAERTRIRPHVIEAIEVDEFDSCGGDFYARGHLRTLARVLGVDATQLLAQYDERYAHAPIDARRVFEAELAAAPSRARDGRGLNWSVLVAAVMAIVLVWSVARLVMDGPVPLADQPVLNGSPGGRASLSGATTEVPVVLTAATGGARVVVRDARQQVVFDAQLAFMQTAELQAAPPVRISSTDGGLQVTVDGVEEGSIGATGQDAQRTYVP